VLVATDVAARGLDLPGIELVLHLDLPRDAQALQHRSGRTGRAGKKGLAVLLCAPAERYRLTRMLAEAGIAPEWQPLPSSDEIRAADERRLADEVAAPGAEGVPAFTEDEVAAARRLLEASDPLRVAATLVRRERARLPAPEELTESAGVARQAPRAPGKRREAPPVEVVWFRINLGREKKADPRWLLPLLCRRGDVTREQIGKIVILPHEARFEVARPAAEHFAASARRVDPRARDVRIGRLLEKPGAGKGTVRRRS
jgi:ATP-dependent RNA helicase DeaD